MFDTETTDKIHYVEDESGKKKAIMPRVIQLGYIYYDTSDPLKTRTFTAFLIAAFIFPVSFDAVMVFPIRSTILYKVFKRRY